MKWEAKKISDAVYFAYGDIFKGMTEAIDSHKELVVSNSFLKSIFKTNLYHRLIVGGEEIDEELQEIFDIGSGFHAYVLEHKEFEDRYHVSDTKDATKETVRISTNDFKFITSAYKNIEAKYPQTLDNENVELAIFGEIDGVKVKCKIDKLNITKDANGNWIHVEISDLKGVYFAPFNLKKSPTGERWKLRNMLSDIGYDLQAKFYTKLVKLWLESCGIYCEVSFSLLVASKETYEVQKFLVGEDMLLTGESKFNHVWNDVVEFVKHGKSALNDVEVL